ncbi:MAG: hypothetical protein NDJ89_02825 [Oligoflexia bacterium]|nr:hypothetical protein [Oligoflexia bacterium]
MKFSKCRFQGLALALLLNSSIPHALALGKEPPSPSQQSSFAPRANSIALEVLGRGILYSLNFNHAFAERFSGGFGLSYFSIPLKAGHSASIYLVPIYGNYYLLEGAHRPYVSLGATFALGVGGIETRDGETTVQPPLSAIAPHLSAGYEYRSSGGFLFRLAPYLYLMSDRTVFTGGISFGFSF